MNKKGFTLIEVIISLVLVSVVLTSMLASLVKLKDTYSVVNENTDALIYSSSVSRVLNNDFLKNGGIRYVNCNVEGDRCDIILSNNQRRRIVIYNNQLSNFNVLDSDTGDGMYCDTTPKCKKGSSECETDENNKIIYFCPIKNIITTLKYTDTTNVDDNTSEGDLIYIKSLKLVENTDLNRGRTYTDGYVFGKMSYTTHEFESANKYINPKELTGPYRNVISSLNIEINDMVDTTDNTYGISIYSSASFPPGMRIGDEIKLIFNNNTTSNIRSLTATTEELIVKYGVSFNVYFKDADGNKYNRLVETKKITPPTAISTDGSTLTFGGYYYLASEDNEIDVIDKNGNILITNTFFIRSEEIIDGQLKETNEKVLHARWN